MYSLFLIDFCHAYDGVSLLVESHVPQPVAAVVGLVDNGVWMRLGISVALLHTKSALLYLAELLALDVVEAAVVDVKGVAV